MVKLNSGTEKYVITSDKGINTIKLKSLERSFSFDPNAMTPLRNKTINRNEQSNEEIFIIGKDDDYLIRFYEAEANKKEIELISLDDGDSITMGPFEGFPVFVVSPNNNGLVKVINKDKPCVVNFYSSGGPRVYDIGNFPETGIKLENGGKFVVENQTSGKFAVLYSDGRVVRFDALNSKNNNKLKEEISDAKDEYNKIVNEASSKNKNLKKLIEKASIGGTLSLDSLKAVSVKEDNSVKQQVKELVEKLENADFDQSALPTVKHTYIKNDKTNMVKGVLVKVQFGKNAKIARYSAYDLEGECLAQEFKDPNQAVDVFEKALKEKKQDEPET